MASDPSQPTELSLDEVRHIAALVRLGMTDDELHKFRRELSSILAHFDVLARIDTDGVEPTATGADLLNVTAPDRPRPSLDPADVLANAPHRQDDYFRVKAVLE